MLVQDEVQADAGVELWWFMHTGATTRIAEDGRTATLEQGGKQLRAEILSPENAKFQTMDAQPLPASPHPERQAKNAGIRKLAIHLTGISDSRLAVLLVPQPAGSKETSQATRIFPLAEW